MLQFYDKKCSLDDANGDFKNIAIVSKPLDLLNAIEYQYSIDLAIIDLEVWVIGNGHVQETTRSICFLYGLRVTNIIDPDLYYRLATRINFLNLPSAIVDLVKVCVGLLGRLLWYYYILKIRLKVKKKKYNRLVLDCWRNKYSVVALLDFKHLVVIDGGYSTVTYDLIGSWDKYGAYEGIKRYLLAQSVSSLESSKSLFTKARFRNYAANRATQMPSGLAWFIDNKIRTRHITLFSAFLDTDNAAFRFYANRYKYSESCLKEKQSGHRVLILGYPAVSIIDRQYSAAVEAINGDSEASIHYQLHPSDIRKMQISKDYESFIKKALNEYPITYGAARYSLEWDLILEGDLPRTIVLYKSSALPWLESVLNGRSNIVLVNHAC